MFILHTFQAKLEIILVCQSLIKKSYWCWGKDKDENEKYGYKADEELEGGKTINAMVTYVKDGAVGVEDYHTCVSSSFAAGGKSFDAFW